MSERRQSLHLMGFGAAVAAASLALYYFRPKPKQAGSSPHREPALPKAYWRHLEHDAVTLYRRRYQEFRLGKAHGTTGELSDVPVMSISTLRAEREQRVFLTQNAVFSVDEQREARDQTAAEAEAEEVQRRVNEFRLAYRRHRQGGHKGAKEDLSALAKALTVVQMDLLPTNKLIALRRQIAKLVPLPRRGDGAYHVHFGAGRLGLGLLVPALCRSEESFALVQRPSGPFGALSHFGGHSIQLAVNGHGYADLKIVTSTEQMPNLREYNRRCLVLTEDPSVLQPLVRHAATFSTSIGPGMPAVAGLLADALEEAGPTTRPALYAGENDHKMVDAMKETLDGKCFVLHCMVDRICTDRTVGNASIDTQAEPYEGAIVVKPLDGPHEPPRPPFAGRNVLLPRLQQQAEYLCRRKIVTVNGMHTTLAFLTLCTHLMEDGAEPLSLVNDKLTAPESDLPLVTLRTASDAQRDAIRAWAAARQLLLLFEFSADVMMVAHDIDGALADEEREDRLAHILWDYASECVERFSTTKDTCGRVLGGGVENRCRTRLQPVGAFLEGATKIDRVSRKVLEAAGVSLDLVRKAVATLCDASQDVIGGSLLSDASREGMEAHWAA